MENTKKDIHVATHVSKLGFSLFHSSYGNLDAIYKICKQNSRSSFYSLISDSIVINNYCPPQK